MKKSDCTPEQWQKHLAQSRESYQRNREARIERCKAYNKTEKAIARRRAYDMRPDVKARRQEREAKPGYRQALWEKIKSDPEKLAKKYAEMRQWRTGMTPEAFDALLIMQGNKCAICSKPFELERKGTRRTAGKSYPCADHCHDGSGPRGLLCHNCNTIEGHVRSLGFDIQEYMQRLHDYLQNPPAKRVKLP